MKKFLSLVMAVIVACSFAFMALGSSNDESTTQNTDSSSEFVSEKESDDSRNITDVFFEDESTSEPETSSTETTTKKETTTKRETTTIPTTNNTQNVSRTVYYTKTGECYHYENPCGRGKYYPCTLQEAKARGLRPCEKCVLH